MNQVQPVRPPTETQHLLASKYAGCDMQVINCRRFYCSLWGGYRSFLQYHKWAWFAAGGWHLPVAGEEMVLAAVPRLLLPGSDFVPAQAGSALGEHSTLLR